MALVTTQRKAQITVELARKLCSLLTARFPNVLFHPLAVAVTNLGRAVLRLAPDYDARTLSEEEVEAVLRGDAGFPASAYINALTGALYVLNVEFSDFLSRCLERDPSPFSEEQRRVLISWLP